MITETRGNAGIGCLGILAVVGATLVLVWFGWSAYNNFRPSRSPLESYFQQVIREALASGLQRPGGGWSEENVTNDVCAKVDASTLNGMGITPYFQAEQQFARDQVEHLDRADIWTIKENKNIFSLCIDHHFKELNIEIQRGTGQCRAFVDPVPACDP